MDWLKEIPASLLLLTIVLFGLIGVWAYTREREVLIFANLTLGAILGIARGKQPTTPTAIDSADTVNIDNNAGKM